MSARPEMDRWLNHVTLTTGHSRRSYLSEVDAGVLSVCRVLLGRLADDPLERVEIPAIAYDLLGLGGGRRCCTLHVYPRGSTSPVVLLGIAAHSRCGARTWRELHRYASEWRLPVATSPDECPPEPWCAALLDTASAELPADDLMALGDLERCLAWARIHDPDA